MHHDTTVHSQKEEKESALPAERRGPGCARCWWSPGFPWLPRSSHSICARLGTAAPGQRESSAYSLCLHTLSRQEETWHIMSTLYDRSHDNISLNSLYNNLLQFLNANILNPFKIHNHTLINMFTFIFYFYWIIIDIISCKFNVWTCVVLIHLYIAKWLPPQH